MSEEYSVQLICALMEVSRSGYYKWLQRKQTSNRYEQKRQHLTKLILWQYKKHPSYGYHRLAVMVRQQTNIKFSDNLIHKCCKKEGIHSRTRHYQYNKPGKKHLVHANKVNGNWKADKPLTLFASDMTCLHHKGKLHEWVYILDVFNNEIIAHSLAAQRGDTKPYFECLKQLKEKLGKNTKPSCIQTKA